MTLNDHYIVSRMSSDEIHTAIDWANKEGWNPGLHDATCFYQTDPNGFFAGKLNNRIIAIGSAVVYDDHFAFFGFYVVHPDYRGKGYGLELTRARLAYIGARNAGLDGVIKNLPIYERIGFKLAYNNARYYGINLPRPLQENNAIVPLSTVHFDQICAYDRLHFPAQREGFLTCWINQKGGKSLGYIEHDKLLGYGVIRPCYRGFKIGPLFANDPTIAEDLFIHLAKHAKNLPIYLDIPVCNQQAMDLVKRYQLEKVFETARMYLKESPEVHIGQIYGITSFELG